LKTKPCLEKLTVFKIWKSKTQSLIKKIKILLYEIKIKLRYIIFYCLYSTVKFNTIRSYEFYWG